jgi:hypothetical protein
MSFEIEFNSNTTEVDHIQEFMNSAQDAFIQEAKNISEQLGVSESCGIDILYLRGRSRWTQELEDRLIELYKQGSPPNICEFE